MRIAAIDIGTNSVHMIVVRVRPDHSFAVVDREKEMVRLGAGGLDGRALTDTAMSAALQALSKFKRLADSHHVDEIIAVATSAVREATNGREFLAAIHHQTGIRPREISGTEEARLIHCAAVYGVDLAGGSAVVIDIGGGSVELILGSVSQLHVAHSAKIGVIRLVERFGRNDPLAGRDERRMVRHIRREIAAPVRDIGAQGFAQVIGTSGTILSLGALASGDGALGSDDLRNRRVSAKQIHQLRHQLTGLTLAQRLQVPGLDPRRADLIAAGAVLLDTILRAIGAKELVLCDFALREGIALDYLHRNRAQIAKVEQYPDVRRRSVVELAERCSYWREHAQQVASLALSLFDQTRSAHALGTREREWLEDAALLHDIGVHISYGRHHKHSYYLIKNGDLRGFEPEEIEIIALVARYHRRATPKRAHPGYRSLAPRARRTVKTLAAVLRLAEALDRSHAQSVAGVDLILGREDAQLRIRASGDAELELWAAQRSVAPLERLLNTIIRFEVTTIPHAEQSEKGPRLPREAVRRRGHRRVGEDHATRPAGQVADGGGPSHLPH